tara:strand:+ start:44 stop:706 length:663 start_codon:yes stop_codon:yes gene_type:complete
MFLSATGKVPGLRESITDAGMVAKYHPRYNQFGQVILRNKMPFDRDDFMGKASNAMFTITRPGGSPMTDEEKEMVYIEQKYKASVLRVNRKLSPYGAGGETVELSPLLYDLLSQYQGNYYRRHLIELRKKPDFIRVFNEAESGSNTSTKKVRDIISAIQSDARSAGTVLLQREHSDLIKELLKERGTSVRKLLVDSLTLSHDPAGKRMLEGWKEEQRGSN